MKLPFLKKQQKTVSPTEKTLEVPTITVKDIIAPASIVLNPNYLQLGNRFTKSFFVFSYPRYLSTGWLAPVVNLDVPLDIGLHIHPVDTGTVLKKLRKKVTEIQAEIADREEKGLIREPSLEIAYHDLETLRDNLMSAQEKMFNFGIYITIYGNSEKELKDIETTLRSILEARLVYIKPTLYQQKEGFNSSTVYGLDQIQVHTLMNTAPLSSAFPFVSFDLSSNEGILYGINRHNNSLILFDRFSLENANFVVFAKSGAGKSYMVKTEVLRQLMFGVESIIIDPENEYRWLTETVGGAFFNISLASPDHINPLDLPSDIPPDENPEDVLRTNIINLVGLMRVMLGGLSSEEDAIMDQALTETYAAKDITPDSDPRTWQGKIPLLEDLEVVLEGMEGAESLLRRLRRFTRGTFAQFFNQPTNISMNKPIVVFGIRDMEDELRPIAMFIIMRYIWNEIRSELRKRILVIDEAWWIMRTPDGASFLFGICKRARKYWLGVTTITQDVGDFMKSEYGKPIITNSSLQLLMKQSPATIDIVRQTFNLTEDEKYHLLESEIGEGIFFAGQKHVLIKVVASYTEDQIITTSPEQIVKIKTARQQSAPPPRRETEKTNESFMDEV